MKKTSWFAAAVAAATLAASLSACSALDVVKTDSVRAFGNVLDASAATKGDGGWRLQSTDGAASLLWEGGRVEMAVDAKPFVDAGLDISMASNANGNELRFSKEFGSTDVTGDTAIADFESLMDNGRENLEFHIAMDHFNFLMDGGMFMWAKDMSINESNKNDQQHDIAFLVDPAPLIAAGVDPNNVEGWRYLPISLSVDGKMTPVDMFMKSVNIA